jgi:hypothetical protein
MPQEHALPYRTYWIAWLVLLAMTVAMIAMSHPGVLLAGIGLKSAIIALWFMHLKWERGFLAASVAVGIVATTLALFGLIVVDAVPS